MENAAKALEIAAGVLLAVIIMSLIAYFFAQIGVWPQEQEKMESAEQLAKFNLEYEVYQKSAMYGVDVISCLNKAKSNNEKYAESGGFFTGASYEEKGEKNNFYIDVYVNIKSPLKESLEIYYMKDNRRVQKFSEDDKCDVTMGDAGFVFSGYTKFDKNTKLNPANVSLEGADYMQANGGSPAQGKAASVENCSGKNYYALRGDDKMLYTILGYSGDNMKQIVTNSTGEKLDIWLQAVWSTGLYDFKTKRFKCDYIGYNDVTGRVKEIYFSELD